MKIISCDDLDRDGPHGDEHLVADHITGTAQGTGRGHVRRTQCAIQD